MAVGIAIRTTEELLAERDAFPQPVPREMFVQWMGLNLELVQRAIDMLNELGIEEIPDENDNRE